MLTCIRSKRQRNAAEYALRTIQSSCIKPYIKTIYLYGSCARGEEKYSSDVDLFLELSESFRSRPEHKKYLYLLKSEVSSEELDDAETDLKIVFENGNIYRILSLERPAAGGESCKQNSFL